MIDTRYPETPSGIPALDEILRGVRLGDNVVWQVDSIEDYRFFVLPFADQSVRDGRTLVYLRFGKHEPLLEPREGMETIKIDPGLGFDAFSGAVNRVAGEKGREAFYLFDNLSTLVTEWATDELLASFFQATCPYLFELGAVAYFAVTRGRHSHETVARLRDTTQILINVFSRGGQRYVHPLKVWDRYSASMFLPHQVAGTSWLPLYDSFEIARVEDAEDWRAGPADQTSAPWSSVYRRLAEHRKTAGAGLDPEVDALKSELARMMLGSHPRLDLLVDRYFTVDDLFEIRHRMIGSGRIGGKAVGMLLARNILRAASRQTRFAGALVGHDSFFIGSDVFFTFLVDNDLFRTRLEVAQRDRLTDEESARIERRFLEGRLRPEIVADFRDMLEHFGQAPIIVRSSSLLEDSYGTAFAGKYESEFCVNQGSPAARLEVFMRAVKRVFASSLNPSAHSYRRRRGLGANDEQMAILVMRVSGRHYGELFFPPLAGVALSRNLFRWSDRIDPSKGLLRLVFGLGTRAVNRLGDDYPRMIPISHPGLRPEVGNAVIKYSQRKLDCLDLSRNELMTIPVARVLADRDFPGWRQFVSLASDGELYEPVGLGIGRETAHPVLTYNGLLTQTDFVALLGDLVAELERVYENPIELEFTATVEAAGQIRVNVLQCRPMAVPGPEGTVTFPEQIAHERVLFRSDRIVIGGIIRRIRHIVYVDPVAYGAASPVVQKTTGRVVGMLNQRLARQEGRTLLIGPGRWGTSNIRLGVNVSYADIDEAAVIVEVAREEAGQTPDVSYGTHFFQDLVEDGIVYLPVHPDRPESAFNAQFFDKAANRLLQVVPDAAETAEVIKLIDVPEVANGAYARVIADSQYQRAVCFLALE